MRRLFTSLIAATLLSSPFSTAEAAPAYAAGLHAPAPPIAQAAARRASPRRRNGAGDAAVAAALMGIVAGAIVAGTRHRHDDDYDDYGYRRGFYGRGYDGGYDRGYDGNAWHGGWQRRGWRNPDTVRVNPPQPVERGGGWDRRPRENWGQRPQGQWPRP